MTTQADLTPRHPYRTVALVVVAVGAIIFIVASLGSEPDWPNASVRTVDLRPGGSFADAERSVAYFERAVRMNPDAARHHVGLAQSLMQRIRETGREYMLLPRAGDAIDRALKLEPDNLHAQILKGSYLNRLHRFEQALTVSNKVLDRAPDHPVALGTRIDALVELGRYADAVEASDRLLSVKPGLPAYARASYLRELHGDADGALRAMEMAAAAGVPGSVERSWVLVRLAEMAISAGRLDEARSILEGTLDEHMMYPPALIGLARLALVEGDLERAESLADQVRSLTGGAAPLEVLLEVHIVRGDEDAAAVIRHDLERAFKRARRIGENVRMEFADFLLDESPGDARALEWARAEYERRPQHLHAGETYAWALHHAVRHKESKSLIEDVLERSPTDPMLMFRAARILNAAGERTAADRLLDGALNGGLALESPAAAIRARRLKSDWQREASP